MDDFRKVIKWTAIALAAVAIADQLRRPSGERTWEGTVVGFVPNYPISPTQDDRYVAVDEIVEEQVRLVGRALARGD